MNYRDVRMDSESIVDRNPLQQLIHEAGEKFQSLRSLAISFARTKEAITNGDELYLWSNEDISAKGYLTPWKFNLAETAATGVLASATANTIQFFAQVPEDSLASREILVNEEFTRHFENIAIWLDPLSVPVILTSVVFFFVWGSLKKRDATPEKRKIARRAYLYFDGAFGLYTQFFLAFSIGVLSTSSSQKLFEDDSLIFLAVVLAVLMFAAGIWQVRVSMVKIPRLVFAVNGYSDRSKHFWQKSLPDDPPWTKLSLAHIIMGYPLLLAVSIVFFALTYGLAYIAYIVSGLFI